MALALIVIPVVIRTTENMLRLVPDSLREAAVALGAPQWKVITLVTVACREGGDHHRYPACGCTHQRRDRAAPVHRAQQPVLVARHEPAHGEPAVVIFQFAMSPYENWQHLAWPGALLITLGVLVLNILGARILPQSDPDLLT